MSKLISKIDSMVTLGNAQKVVKIVDQGLTNGMGKPEPGKLCVEAAVCLALGLPHDDEPPCVGKRVRSVKIDVNDSDWMTKASRAAGMRKLAVQQLGSNKINQEVFLDKLIYELVEVAIRKAWGNNAVLYLGLIEDFKLDSNFWAISDFIREKINFPNKKREKIIGDLKDEFINDIIRRGCIKILTDVQISKGLKKRPIKSKRIDEFLTCVCDCISSVLVQMNSPGVALWDQLPQSIQNGTYLTYTKPKKPAKTKAKPKAKK